MLLPIQSRRSRQPKDSLGVPAWILEIQQNASRCDERPSTFQNLTEWCMGDMHLKGALVFLDDVIVFSKTLEHEER